MLGGINPLMMKQATAPFVASTWNSADKDTDITLTNVNRTAAATTANRNVRATAAATVKSYFEVLIDNAIASTRIGLGTAAMGLTDIISNVSTAVSYASSGAVRFNTVELGPSSAYTTGDRIMFSFDPAISKFWVGLNGTWDGNPAAGTGGFTGPSGSLFPVASPGAGGQVTANFGASAFTYSVPSGFTAWS